MLPRAALPCCRKRHQRNHIQHCGGEQNPAEPGLARNQVGEWRRDHGKGTVQRPGPGQHSPRPGIGEAEWEGQAEGQGYRRHHGQHQPGSHEPGKAEGREDGRLQPREAVWFGLAVTVLGLAYLALTVNLLSACVTGFITISYLLFYTPLKRRSPLCMLVGAVPGALPPVIGWVATRGILEVDAWVLFAIIMVFTALVIRSSDAWVYYEGSRR